MSRMRPFRFGIVLGVPGEISTRSQWRSVVRKAEDLGYATVLVPDHFWIPFTRSAGSVRCTEGMRAFGRFHFRPERLGPFTVPTLLLVGSESSPLPEGHSRDGCGRPRQRPGRAGSAPQRDCQRARPARSPRSGLSQRTSLISPNPRRRVMPIRACRKVWRRSSYDR
jgi:hypothetical protein